MTVNRPQKFSHKLIRFWKRLGPGLVTPWTALVTFPRMASVQEMCAQGLTGTLKKSYPRPLAPKESGVLQTGRLY